MNTKQQDLQGNFVMAIPKEVILEKTLPKQRVATMCYICGNTSYGKCMYSPVYINEYCNAGLKWQSCTSRNTAFFKYRDCFEWLDTHGYISKFDKDNFKKNELGIVEVNSDMVSDNYAIINKFEFDIIKNIDCDSTSRDNVFLVFAYVKAFMWKRFTRISGHFSKDKKNKPEVFITYMTNMENCLGLSRRRIQEAINVLVENGLLYVDKMKRYKDEKDNWHTDKTIFVCPYKVVYTGKLYRFCTLEEYDWKEELYNAKEFLRKSKISNKKFYQD